MEGLVKTVKGIPMANSLVIAEKFKKPHKRVLSVIEKLIEDTKNLMDKTSAVRLIFKEATYDTRGRNFKCYEMNRDAFSLLAMGFIGKKALQWKIDFIGAFNEMERVLLNQTNLEWKKQREQGKLIRKEESDTIQRFVELAKSQGSKSAQWYYKHFTNATYKALQLIEHKKPKLRDTLDMLELNQLILAENIAMKSIEQNIDSGEHYKVIFVNVKNDIERFASTLFLNHQKQIIGNI